ncbi:PKD domain-containing protein, partial [Flavobacterium sp. GSN2]
MKNKYLLLFVFFLFTSIAFAQTYNMANGANGTISSCSGTFRDGAGNYSANQNSTITFCPTTPGDLIRITFTSFDTENGYDYLDMWQGSSVGAVGTNDEHFTGAVGAFTVTSSDPSGCLSFQFISDNITQAAGWSATVSCITPCTPPVAALSTTATLDICPPTSVSPGSLTVPFNGSPSTTSSGVIAKWEWDWGDGTTSVTTVPNTTHTFPTMGFFVVKLKVRNNITSSDPLGCESTNSVTRNIRVMPPPNFTGSTTGPINITCGSSTTLNALAASQTITQATPSIVGSTISLPNGTGASYQSSVDYTGFFPTGATMSAGCYPTLTFNIEHSYSGDLSIDLISPSGETVRVYNNGYGNSNLFGTCVNGVDGDGIAGCGATYTVVNSGGIAWPPGGTIGTTTVSTACGTYTGSCQVGNYYIPQTYNSMNPFSVLNGADLNGVWSIRVTDNLNFDDGTLFNWSLSFPAACYASLQSVTPGITTATWSNGGSGPLVPAQTTTSTVVTNPGPGVCPAPGPCLGNQLANNITIGPFPNPGSFIYNLTAVDQFGCQYLRPVTVNVTAVCPTATISYAGSPYCKTSGVQLVTLNGTAAYTGGTYSSIPAGLTIDPVTGTITPSTSTTGAYTVFYTIPISACCASPVVAQTNVTITPNNTIALTSAAGTNSQTVCTGTPIAAITYATTGATG